MNELIIALTLLCTQNYPSSPSANMKERKQCIVEMLECLEKNQDGFNYYSRGSYLKCLKETK